MKVLSAQLEEGLYVLRVETRRWWQLRPRVSVYAWESWDTKLWRVKPLAWPVDPQHLAGPELELSRSGLAYLFKHSGRLPTKADEYRARLGIGAGPRGPVLDTKPTEF